MILQVCRSPSFLLSRCNFTAMECGTTLFAVDSHIDILAFFPLNQEGYMSLFCSSHNIFRAGRREVNAVRNSLRGLVLSSENPQGMVLTGLGKSLLLHIHQVKSRP